MQAVERPARGRLADRRGRLLRPHRDLSASTWRHVRFVELFEPSPQLREEAQRALEAGAGASCRRSRPPARSTSSMLRSRGRWTSPRQCARLGDWVFMSDVCKHCTNAGCLDACPTGALIRTEFQTVVLQPDVCNGCGYCVTACPFGVVDRDHIDGRAGKCTLCYDRLEDGLEPPARSRARPIRSSSAPTRSSSRSRPAGSRSCMSAASTAPTCTEPATSPRTSSPAAWARSSC